MSGRDGSGEARDSFAQLSLSDAPSGYSQPTQEQVLSALKLVFHPRRVTLDGSAANCLNALLQGPYFDEQTLLSQMGSETLDSYHLNFALDAFKLSLEPVVSCRRSLPPQDQKAFLLLHHKRWFTLRRFGKHWINLSDRVSRPCQILPAHLALSLSHLQQDGCVAYVVKGDLPACTADAASLFDTHFQWNLRPVRHDDGDDDDEDEDEDEDPDDDAEDPDSHFAYGPCGGEECDKVGVCVCGSDEEGADEGELDDEDAFARDLEAAIRLSLIDAGAGKELCIRRKSPSTSAVSEE